MNIVILILTLLILVAMAGPSEALEVSETPIFPVSPSNVNAFATPTAYYQGNIYVVSVEPPAGISNGVNLRTVVRKGYQHEGKWMWETTVIDDHTLDDLYHTQASIAIDKEGYVHVAYNMHNMPWQYAISKRPGDIASFDFKGDTITLAEKAIVKHLNKTRPHPLGRQRFPGIKSPTRHSSTIDEESSISPIVSPHDQRKTFGSRGFAFALARYDVLNRRWIVLGGPIKVTSGEADLPAGMPDAEVKAFVFSEGWQPQLLRLFFDKGNHMHVSWTWREFFGGSPFVRPSYAYSQDLDDKEFCRADGLKYVLPIHLQDSGLLFPNHLDSQLNSPLAYLTAEPDGTPYVVTLEKGKPSEVRYFERHANRWSDPEPMPESAQLMEIDDSGRQWAFASGLKIFTRSGPSQRWLKVYEDKGNTRFGYFKALNIHKQNQFLVYSQSVDGEYAKVYQVRKNRTGCQRR